MFEDRKDLAETAIFAGGCFWCVESAFLNLNGVYSVKSGYTGGHVKKPTYQMVCEGDTGHYEAVKIKYNPLIISFYKLLNIFFMQIDPEDEGGQFADRGQQYQTAVFYTNDLQYKITKGFIEKFDSSNIFSNKIATKIIKAKDFYEAEKYHQNYSINNEIEFKRYKEASGRKNYISNLWKNSENINELIYGGKYQKLPNDELKSKLSSLEYSVTQDKGTERAFDNEYWDNYKKGIYVDVVSFEPLFDSIHKFKSGSGWPSFTRPLVADNIVYIEGNVRDRRTEVRSKHANSHLGHVFEDGDIDTKLRYCINSAALKFVAADDLDNYQLEEFKYLFEK